MSKLGREGEGREKRKEKKGEEERAVGREERRQRGRKGLSVMIQVHGLIQKWVEGLNSGIFLANSRLDPLHDSPSEHPLERSQRYHFVNGTPQVLGA